MSEFKKKFKALVKEDFTYSSIHGFSNMANSKHMSIQVFWAICVLVAMSACTYLMATCVISYLKYEVITKLSIVGEVSSLFPTVTICNSVPFMTSNSTSFEYNILSSPYFSKFLNYTDNNEPLEPLQSLGNYLASINAEIQSDDVKKAFGLTIDQMLISCLYSGSACSYSDFEWFYNPLYGNCFRFNGGTNGTALRTSTNTGKWNGLRLELYVGSSNDIEINRMISGIHVYIHNSTSMPSFYEGLDVASSFETNIAVSRTFFSKLTSPYSDCLSDSDAYFYQKLVASNGKYRFRDCIRLCFQELLIQECECQDPFNPILNESIPLCNTLIDLFQCEYPLYSQFFNADMEASCPYCKFECESIKYAYSASFNEYPSEEYGDFLLRLNKIRANNITTFDKLKRNVLSLNIYYDVLQYKVIEEVPSTDLVTLISGLGGTMGLILGMSFLSVLELVEICLNILFLKLDLSNAK